MKVLSKSETTLWCASHHIALDARGLPERSDVVQKFSVSSDAQRRVALVKHTMEAFVDERAVLVWFDDWSVWPSGQRMHVFDRFRMAYGESRRLIDSPGHIFDQTEIEDATSFVTLAVLFLWDCYVVTPNRSKLLYFSHDEHGAAKGLDIANEVDGRM
jgi:hypothetical protein